MGKRLGDATAKGTMSKRETPAHIRYNLPFITQSALAALCRWSIVHGGLPDIQNRRGIRNIRDELANARNTYGSVVVSRSFETLDGDSLDIEI